MKLKSFLFVTVLGLFMNSCSGDDVTTQSTKGTPIKFTANIQSIAPSFGTRVDNTSSGILTDVFPVGSEISVGYNNSSIPPVLKKTEDGWAYDGLELCYPLDGSSQSIYAVYPKISKSIQNLIYGSYTSPSDQSQIANYQAADILAAGATVSTPSGTPVALSFKHLGAKINVKLTSAVSTYGYKITIKDILTQTLFSYTSSSLSLNSTPPSTTKGDIIFGTHTTNAQTAIIIPQKISADKVLFEVSNGTSTFTYTTSSEITFKAGCEYTFNLTFSQTSISPGDITVGGWISDSAQPNDIAGSLVQ